MKFEELTEKFLKENTLFTSDQYPKTLYLPEKSNGGIFGSKNEFWNRITDLHKFTTSGSKNFREDYQGSTGWEYEIIMIYAFGKFYYSKPSTSKDYTKVNSSHSLNIKMDYDQKNLAVYDKIYLDNQNVGTITWKGENELKNRNDILENKKFSLGFVCHFHTHPLLKYSNINKNIYSFYSAQDLHSFFNSNMNLMALITDRLWMIAKTQTSKMVPTELLNQISQEEFKGVEEMKSLAANIFEEYGIVLYYAPFNFSYLGKVN